jgi:hypothetical protein
MDNIYYIVIVVVIVISNSNSSSGLRLELEEQHETIIIFPVIGKRFFGFRTRFNNGETDYSSYQL